jgi:hypothetical protein
MSKQGSKKPNIIGNLHCDIVEHLRGVVWRAVRTAFSGESRCDLGHGVLVVRQGAPVGAINDEDDEGERCTRVSLTVGVVWQAIQRTVSQDKLSNACKHHRERSKEVVVGSEADQCVRRHGSAELT